MHNTSNIVKVDPHHPEDDIIQNAGKTIMENKVVVFPAQYMYGIAVHALNPKALKTVFEIKNRSVQNPLLAFVKNLEQLKSLVASIPDTAYELMEKYWPGNVTIIFQAQPHIPELLTAGTDKIGLRMPWHPVARKLIKILDVPITGTSANISGKPGCSKISHMDETLIKKADLILDAGTLKQGKGSTIVDITQHPARIIRQGELFIEKQFLFNKQK